VSAEEVEAVSLRKGSLPNFLHLSFFKSCYKALKDVWIVSNLVLVLTNSHVKAKLRYSYGSPCLQWPLLPVYGTDSFRWVSILWKSLSKLRWDQINTVDLFSV